MKTITTKCPFCLATGKKVIQKNNKNKVVNCPACKGTGKAKITIDTSEWRCCWGSVKK